MNSFSAASFSTYTLSSQPWGEAVCRILQSALQAVDPYQIVLRNVRSSRDHLQMGNVNYDLSNTKRVYLLAIGKASAPMALALGEVLGIRLHYGLVIIKPGHDLAITLPPTMHVVEADHPLPGERSLEAGKKVEDLVSQLQENDLLICLISGGGSALCVLPQSGIQLAELQRLNAALLSCGANINEINTVRKHLDRLKGGGLVRLSAPANIGSLILSDVVGDPIDGIASGLTAADPSTFDDAMQVLERYQLSEREHGAIFDYIRGGVNGEKAETPKPGEAIFGKVHNLVVGSNLLAAQAALDKATQEGFHSMLLTTHLQGEAREAGRFLASVIQQLSDTNQPIQRPCCIIAGGETTVSVRGEGLGGRNLELALGTVRDLAGLQDIALITLATDGGDGMTDAAGAVVTGETLKRALNLGMQPEDYLARNDSYHFFAPLGDLIKPGPTMTNVNDLTFLVAL